MSKSVALVTRASQRYRQSHRRTLSQRWFFCGRYRDYRYWCRCHFRLSWRKRKGLKLDVANNESVESVIKTVSDTYGAPTVLVNNAGITRDNLLMRMKDEEWDDIINTNLTSVFRMSKAVLRGMMKAKTGRIINISSVVGSTGNAGQANYAAAKAGMVGFAKSMAKEVGSRNITINTVAPGFIDTDMTKALGEDQHAALLTQIPLGRLGKPEDIAAAVAFLASPQAAYITGTTLHVNGGMYMN